MFLGEAKCYQSSFSVVLASQQPSKHRESEDLLLMLSLAAIISISAIIVNNHRYLSASRTPIFYKFPPD